MEFVEQLKSTVDIVKVIGEYVRLRKMGGAARWVGLCPFHTEKTPSFSVNATHQFYKCFGCGAGGDVLKFVMEIERISFFEALKLLAERYGIAMPKRAEYSDPEARLRGSIFEMHEIAARLFRASLNAPAGAEARAYLAKRGLAPAIIEEFGLGYAERSGQVLVQRYQKDGFTAEQLEASGLVSKRQDGSGYFDRFRNRLMFPVRNESGKVIGFGGRTLAGEDPKYLNSPETTLYRKSYVLYNLDRAKEAVRKLDQAVLVEGYMDVIGVWAGGVREVVASCGTALTVTQVRALKRHSENIVVNFDPDAAGSNAAERSIQMLLDEGMRVRILELDGGLDPDEYVKERGAGAYREKLERAGGYFHWLADRALARRGRAIEGRLKAIEDLLPAIQKMQDRLERVAIANDVALYLGVESSLVLDQFRKAALDRRPAPRPAAPAISPVERILLAALLASAEVRDRILPRLKAVAALEQFATRRIFATLIVMWEGGQRVGFAELEARLEEADRGLLAAAVLADESSGENVSIDQAESCLRTLEASDRAARVAALKARIRQAEGAGDMAAALTLAEELNRLTAGGTDRPVG